MREINVTTDYEVFKFISSNRDIKPLSLAKIKKSMEKKSLLQEFPILVNRKHEIVDGQHRFTAAKELGIPVYYLITDNIKNEDIAEINSVQSGWNCADYVKYYADRGNNEYKILQSFVNKYSFSVFDSAKILGGGEAFRLLNKIKQGSYRTKDYNEGECIAEHILNFSEYIGFYRTKFFVAAIIRLWKHDEYDPGAMMKKLEFNSAKLKKQADAESYIKVLEEIYNYHSRSRVRFI